MGGAHSLSDEQVNVLIGGEVILLLELNADLHLDCSSMSPLDL